MIQNIAPGSSIVIVSCFIFPLCSIANDEILKNEIAERLNSYQNPFEALSDQQGKQINEWLNIKTTIELEKEKSEVHYLDSNTSKTHIPSSQLLEIDLDAVVGENLSVNFILEAESQGKVSRREVTDGVVKFIHEQSELTVGRFDVPYTEFSSRFITAPLLEFGETKADAIALSHSFQDYQIKVDFIVLQSFAGKTFNNNGYDYAYSISWVNTQQTVKIGAGFLSDLAESDARFLADFENVYANKVGAVSYFLRFTWNRYELTAETIRATGSFTELDADRGQPGASNFEISWYPVNNLLFSIRYENTNELVDEPEELLGLSAAWRPSSGVELAAEYFRANYKNNFVFNDNNIGLRYSNSLVTRFTLEF